MNHSPAKASEGASGPPENGKPTSPVSPVHRIGVKVGGSAIAMPAGRVARRLSFRGDPALGIDHRRDRLGRQRRALAVAMAPIERVSRQ
jgi:hypothetical protein